jgi:hypothetical protein
MPQEIDPQKVTKPIQLLAAWLLGLVLVNTAFLSAAKMISSPGWVCGTLVLAAIVNVPLFLLCIFLLQTKFRPEMQEDVFYSKYLEVQSATRTSVSPIEQTAELRKMIAESNMTIADALKALENRVGAIPEPGREAIDEDAPMRTANFALESYRRALGDAQTKLQWQMARVSVNDLLKSYPKVLESLAAGGIPVGDKFGSNSSPAVRPKYSVISIGDGVPMNAVGAVVSRVAQFEDWFIELPKDPMTTGQIYIGAYGYGGEKVVRLTSELTEAIVHGKLSREQLEQWLERGGTVLDADYPVSPD